MKAIAKNPRERYATAQELADDLGRYLDHMPIHAKRPTLLQRTNKWAHRNQTFVRTTIATVAVAAMIGGALLWEQRSRTLAAREQAEANLVLATDAAERETRQRELAQENLQLAEENAAGAERQRLVAEENFRQTRTAVDDYFTTVSESKLLDQPDLAPLRQELLESAVKYYQGFTEKHTNDPELAAELAAAHIRLAHVYGEQGSKEWISETATVVDLVERLVSEGADVSGWKGLREGVLFKNAQTIQVIGNSSEVSLKAFDGRDALRVFGLCKRAIPVWEQLVDSHPDVTGFTSDLAGFHFIQGGFYDVVGNRFQSQAVV